ncbi:MAG: NAD(P)H-dependent glycerol-3-phosphate dehydrogenase [Nitrospirae bacterium]|nr:NAD(P)H-dependent glycerol-3-phosphate dehydrogenase [Nitrospirota bacterium]
MKQSTSEKIAVIGAGSWGTTLAMLLADKGYHVKLWVYEPDLAEEMQKSRENKIYLPGHRLPDNIIVTSIIKDAVKDAGVLVFVVPSHVARGVIKGLAHSLSDNIIIVSAAKGIENDTLMLMSDIFKEVLPEPLHKNLTFLSGPSFAKEVVKKMPTAVALAAYNKKAGESVQGLFSTDYFRVLTNSDVKGVELGGALKNVIAIATGISDGMGFGHNTRAAIITRGLAEITRLGIAMGAEPATFAGLSGLGDLILTCTGELSRNRTVGFRLGQGEGLKDILNSMKMVAEGVKTTKAAYELSKKHKIEMPITNEVYYILYEGKDVKVSARDLMKRELGEE